MCCWALFCDCMSPEQCPNSWILLKFAFGNQSSQFLFILENSSNVAAFETLFEACWCLASFSEFFVKDILNIFFHFIAFSWKYDTERKILVWFLFLRAMKLTKRCNLICCRSFPILVDVPEVSPCLGLVSVCFCFWNVVLEISSATSIKAASACVSWITLE